MKWFDAVWMFFNAPGRPRWMNWISHVIPGFLFGIVSPAASMGYGILREAEQAFVAGRLVVKPAKTGRVAQRKAWLDHIMDYVFWFLGAWLAGFLLR